MTRIQVFIALLLLLILSACYRNDLSGPKEEQPRTPPLILSFFDMWECHESQSFDRSGLLRRIKGKWIWNLRLDLFPNGAPIIDTNRMVYQSFAMEFINDQDVIIYDSDTDTISYHLRSVVQERARIDLPFDSIPQAEGVMSICEDQMLVEHQVDYLGGKMTVEYNYFYKE